MQCAQYYGSATGWKILWKKTCGKTTNEMGKQHQEGLLVAAE
jgi:hypothetical protein